MNIHSFPLLAGTAQIESVATVLDPLVPKRDVPQPLRSISEMLATIEHFTEAMRRSIPHTPSWYHYMKMRAVNVRNWRETNTLTSVKR